MHYRLSVFSLTFLLFFIINTFSVQTFAKGTYREQLYIATDRDYYVAGENVNFHMYFFNENERDSLRSAFAYVALRNEHGVVNSEVLNLEKNGAGGFLSLSDTLSSGNYELLGFTRWMRNQGEASFFRKQIFVANRFDESLDAMEPVFTEDAPFEVYAESGAWVYGHPNTFVISAVKPGTGAYRRVFLFDNNEGDTLHNYRLNSNGYGVFSFTPQHGRSYAFHVEGQKEPVVLSKRQNEPITFSVANMQGGIQVSILMDSLKSGRDNFLNTQIRINGYTAFDHAITVADSCRFDVFIEEDKLPAGLLTIELITDNTRLSRRWFAEKMEVKAPTFAYSPEVGLRANMNLAFNSDEVSAAKNIAVVPSASISSLPVKLPSYLRAYKISRAHSISEFDFALMSGLSHEELNAYLIRPAREVSSSMPAQERKLYALETIGRIISGKLVSSQNGAVIPQARVILNVPGKQLNLQYAFTDEQGRFSFVLSDFYHDKELYFTIDPSTVNEKAELVMDDVFNFKRPFENLPVFHSRENRRFVEKSQQIAGVKRSYDLNGFYEEENSSSRVERAEVNPFPLFSEPIEVILPSDFIPLSDLLEISREIIPAWRLTQSGNQFRSRLLCNEAGQSISGQQIYFLDGVIEFEIGKLVHLSSADIEEIWLHNVPWVFGNMAFPGIIAFFTHDNEYQKIYLENDKHVVLNPRILEDSSALYAEQRHKTASDSHTPYLHQTLYWNSFAHHAEDEKAKRCVYYTGDLKGEYLIRVQGVDESGNTFFANYPLIVN